MKRKYSWVLYMHHCILRNPSEAGNRVPILQVTKLRLCELKWPSKTPPCMSVSTGVQLRMSDPQKCGYNHHTLLLTHSDCHPVQKHQHLPWELLPHMTEDDPGSVCYDMWHISRIILRHGYAYFGWTTSLVPLHTFLEIAVCSPSCHTPDFLPQTRSAHPYHPQPRGDTFCAATTASTWLLIISNSPGGADSQVSGWDFPINSH